MKTAIRKTLCFALSVILAVCMLPVSASAEGERVFVMFNRNKPGSSVTAPIWFDYGHILTQDELPEWTDEGYIAVGWYTDRSCSPESEFDVLSTPITKNLTLYAKWVPNTYLDYDTASGKMVSKIIPDTATGIYAGTTTVSSGWYYFNGKVSLERLNVKGTVNIVLRDGADVSVSKSILLADNAKLTIYAQSDNTASTGRLTVNANTELDYGAPAIGSYRDCSVTVNGGIINAFTEYNGAAIGTGMCFSEEVNEDNSSTGTTVTINGGTVNATSSYGTGIGCGSCGFISNQKASSKATVVINGGRVTAKGGKTGIGCGNTSPNNSNVSKAYITINNAEVTAVGICGIGGTDHGTYSELTLNGSKVNVSSTMDSGISCNSLKISGSDLSVTGYNKIPESVPVDDYPIFANSAIVCGNISVDYHTYDVYVRTFHIDSVPDKTKMYPVIKETVKADSYNGEYGVEFRFKGHIAEQTFEETAPVFNPDGTLKTAGHRAYYRCSCGKYFENDPGTVEIKDLSAWLSGAGRIEYYTFEEVKATCTENGHRAYYLRNGIYYTSTDFQTVIPDIDRWAAGLIPAYGHSYGPVCTVKSADCTEDGLQTMTCYNCGDIDKTVIPAYGHDFDENNVCRSCGYILHIHSFNGELLHYDLYHFRACTADGCTLTAEDYLSLSDDVKAECGFEEHTFTDYVCECGFEDIQSLINDTLEEIAVYAKNASSDKAKKTAVDACSQIQSLSTVALIRSALADFKAAFDAAEKELADAVKASSGIINSCFSELDAIFTRYGINDTELKDICDNAVSALNGASSVDEVSEIEETAVGQLEKTAAGSVKAYSVSSLDEAVSALAPDSDGVLIAEMAKYRIASVESAAEIMKYTDAALNAIAALGIEIHVHTFSDTFIADEYTHRRAATCGHDELVTDFGAHEWITETVKKAEGDESGIMLYTCAVCGYEKTEVIPAPGTDPDSGGTSEKCERCGKVHADNFFGRIICFINRLINTLSSFFR